MPYTLIFTFLKNYGLYILIALAIAGGLARYHYMASEIKKDEAAIVIYKQDVVTLTDANKTLSASIDTQNKAVTSLGEQLKAAELAFVNLNGSIVDAGNASQAQVAAILHQKAPTTCQASIDYLRNFGVAK